MRLVNAMNRWFDSLVRTQVGFAQRSWPAFQVCGYTGLVLAITLAMVQAHLLRLSLLVMAGVAATAVATFFALAMAAKIMTGEESLVYYHHEVAIIATTSAVVWLLGHPVLPYLDVTILAVGTFLICGRIGCLMVGCCHGRPFRWGVCYRQEHAAAGFTPHYAGVRLFPIQLVESLWVLLVVVGGCHLLNSSTPPGTALAWYVVTYDIGRFCFELVRGDPERPYYLGFSEGQWTSLLLMCGVLWAELAGTIPWHTWHAIATIGIALVMIVIGGVRYLFGLTTHRLLNPRHIREVAEIIGALTDAAAPTTDSIPLGHTSQGIRISAGTIGCEAGTIAHYALSRQNRPLTAATATSLARLIIQLAHRSTAHELVPGSNGVYHLLVHPDTSSLKRCC